MPSRRVPITNVYCSQVHVGQQSGRNNLYETTFDLANFSNLRVKLGEVLKEQYGDMYFDLGENFTEKATYTLYVEPNVPTVKHKGGLITFNQVAALKGTLCGEVDVYINDVDTNIVAIDNAPQGNVTIGNVKVHVKDNLTLR